MLRRRIATLALAALPCLAFPGFLPGQFPPGYTPPEAAARGPTPSFEQLTKEAPPKTTLPAPALPYPVVVDGPTYVVYLRVVEGPPGIFQGIRGEEDLARWVAESADVSDLSSSIAELTGDRSPSPRPWRPLPAPAADAPTSANAAPPTTFAQPQPENASDGALRATPDSSEEPFDTKSALRKLLAHPEVTILAAPKLMVIQGQEAQVRIGSQQVFTYLVPVGKNRYEARVTDMQELGIHIRLTVQATDDPAADGPAAVQISPIEFEIASLDGREPVQGLNLDVGRPIVAARSLKTSVQMPLGGMRVLSLPSNAEMDAMLFLEVERAEPPPK